MTDLISRVKNLKPETINKLNDKYESILSIPDIKNKENAPYFLYIINLSVNYIQETHKDESKDWKAFAILLVKKLIEEKSVKTKEELFEYIDQFFEYKKSEYENYISNITSYSDEFQKNLGFIFKFMSSLK